MSKKKEKLSPIKKIATIGIVGVSVVILMIRRSFESAVDEMKSKKKG